MGLYTDLVVDTSGQMSVLAGYNHKYNRPMIVNSDYKGNPTAKNMEIFELRRNIRPETIVEFYNSQKVFAEDRSLIIVIDVTKDKFEVSVGERKRNDRFSYNRDSENTGLNQVYALAANHIHADKESVRWLTDKMIYGTARKEVIEKSGTKNKPITYMFRRKIFNSIIDEVLEPVIETTRKLSAMNGVFSGKILLSGKLFDSAYAVDKIKDSFVDYKVYAYKASEAAVLGASLYLHKNSYNHKAYEFDDKEVYYNYDYNMSWYKRKLTKTQQEMYEVLLQAVRHHVKNLDLPGESSHLSTMRMAIAGDCPETEIHHSYFDSEIRFKRISNVTVLNYTPHYRRAYKSNLKAVNDKAEEIIQNALAECRKSGEQVSDRELIQAIYKTICTNYFYCKEKRKNGTYPDYAYTLEALLKKGVCQGYAVSMVHMARMLQLPVMYVRGACNSDASAHAWNIIQCVDGTYRHIDATWDLEKTEFKKMKYLELDDYAIMARKHYIFNKLEYPQCV